MVAEINLFVKYTFRILNPQWKRKISQVVCERENEKISQVVSKENGDEMNMCK